MNTLVYGMQSSGATLITILLGQIQDSVVIPDVWAPYRLPDLTEAKENADHVIAKCVITTGYDVEQHASVFSPDIKLLVLRHPYHNYVSLRRKSYKHTAGYLNDKFRILEHHFTNKDWFDAIIIYEDVILRPEESLLAFNRFGLEVTPDMLLFPRSRGDITRYNMANSRWCRENYEHKWGFGNARFQPVDASYAFKYISREDKRTVDRLCPRTVSFMNKYYDRHVSYGSYIKGSILHDLVGRSVGRSVKDLSRPLRHRAAGVLLSPIARLLRRDT